MSSGSAPAAAREQAAPCGRARRGGSAGTGGRRHPVPGSPDTSPMRDRTRRRAAGRGRAQWESQTRSVLGEALERTLALASSCQGLILGLELILSGPRSWDGSKRLRVEPSRIFKFVLDGDAPLTGAGELVLGRRLRLVSA